MITYVLFNKDTPAERQAGELVERFKADQVDAELLDADSPRGIQLAETYDIMGRPAVILLKADGAPVKVWQGEDIPTVAEVGYLSRQ